MSLFSYLAPRALPKFALSWAIVVSVVSVQRRGGGRVVQLQARGAQEESNASPCPLVVATPGLGA